MPQRSLGTYRTAIEILARIPAAKIANGEIPESWPATGPAYSAATDSLNAGEQLNQGVNELTGLRKLAIRGRQIPVVVADRIKLVETGELYKVTGVARDEDGNDTILTVERAVQQTTGQ